ncbi:MAG: hypothetical protein Q9190_006756 [Brigantiaea leucoxantha]
MPPRKSPTDSNKRKASEVHESPSKKVKKGVVDHKNSTDEEQYGIIDRQFYPPEMTNERCAQYNSNQIERPIEALSKTQKETEQARDAIDVNHAVVHWFKRDLRTKDNKSLHMASKLAKSHGVPLVCLHIISPQDYKAHMTSAVRVDFILRSLEVLKKDLGDLDIPLHVETVDKRKAIPDRIFELCEKWGASHLFCNIEYEVDELRREALMTRKGVEWGIAVHAVPDTCVVAPGELSSQTGSQYAVYSPWYRAWVAYLHKKPYQLNLFDPPKPNPKSSQKEFEELFNGSIPKAPSNKTLTTEEMKRFHSMWPAGEHEALERLAKFLKEKADNYKDSRNYPAANGTAMLSVHFASGTLSARTAVAAARDANSTKKLDGGNAGISSWISEVAWRDFYKHVLVHWPFVWYVLSLIPSICTKRPFPSLFYGKPTPSSKSPPFFSFFLDIPPHTHTL